jgi:hypothetical protein
MLRFRSACRYVLNKKKRATPPFRVQGRNKLNYHLSTERSFTGFLRDKILCSNMFRGLVDCEEYHMHVFLSRFMCLRPRLCCCVLLSSLNDRQEACASRLELYKRLCPCLCTLTGSYLSPRSDERSCQDCQKQDSLACSPTAVGFAEDTFVLNPLHAQTCQTHYQTAHFVQ